MSATAGGGQGAAAAAAAAGEQALPPPNPTLASAAFGLFGKFSPQQQTQLLQLMRMAGGKPQDSEEARQLVAFLMQGLAAAGLRELADPQYKFLVEATKEYTKPLAQQHSERQKAARAAAGAGQPAPEEGPAMSLSFQPGSHQHMAAVSAMWLALEGAAASNQQVKEAWGRLTFTPKPHPMQTEGGGQQASQPRSHTSRGSTPEPSTSNLQRAGSTGSAGSAGSGQKRQKQQRAPPRQGAGPQASASYGGPPAGFPPGAHMWQQPAPPQQWPQTAPQQWQPMGLPPRPPTQQQNIVGFIQTPEGLKPIYGQLPGAG